ncbi:MAG: SMC-Scp complex subunit ScpB [Elusimicrobia bacterium CG1_02_37_114]|nr:MAG: SMC-Scp complex subunit ScpB [Elusimicrobia bacterium CG1_02_37_114]PIV54136.1 MAG: SMC-Scp complex subunit ScpB [Elusimicrobia bacterium CG02_land_8_20_14_3_00_37_13]PIZ13048.1 MAG: SMC-Scp complex subunit ScpB [Elusimicrobia bacterium CG_4_10_14_0_8_um_filter_37_32]
MDFLTKQELKKSIEALLFITDKPISLDKFEEIFEGATKEQLMEIIDELKKEYVERDSAIGVREIANGFQFATKSDYSPWVRKLLKDRITLKLSTSALETLAIVAYKQPITRAEIEEIRGVEIVSVLETLLERRLIRIVGRKETVGRPLLYGTTQDFLRYFGLRNLVELPSLEEFTPAEAAETEETESNTEE